MRTRTGIVLAGLAGSCVAPLAHAQGTELTIYGRAHVSLENITSSGKGSTQALKNNTSRLGFRGKEALGDGLEAFFQIESGVALDDGTSTGSNVLAGRDSWVGLRNDYGAVKLGRFYHPYDDLHSISGNYFQLFTGTSNDAALWANGSDSRTGGFDERLPNTVSYESPTLGGWSGKLWYSFGRNDGGQEEVGSEGMYAVSAHLMYQSGPLKAAWGHLQMRNMQTTSAGFYEDGYSNFLTAGYQFGPLYVAGLVEYDELQDINRSGEDRTRNYWHLLAKYTVNAHTVGAFYGKADDWEGDAGREDSGAQMYTVGYNYALSKRTQVYTLYTKLKNESEGAYVLGGSPARARTEPLSDWTVASGKQRGVVAGIVHNF